MRASATGRLQPPHKVRSTERVDLGWLMNCWLGKRFANLCIRVRYRILDGC
nr:MAG TPA: hypothetical protein [Caudoviricetes sp.]